MHAFLLIIHVILAITLIGLILIQHGRGADAGAAFGSGASATVFGARGSASFLTKITTFLAIGFFANSLALAYLSAKQSPDSSLMDRVQLSEPQTADQGSASIENPESNADAAKNADVSAQQPATGSIDTPDDTPGAAAPADVPTLKTE